MSAKPKIIRRDYLSFILMLFTLGAVFLVPVAVFIWLITIPLLIWRVKSVKRVLLTGVLTKARITDRVYGRGEWRIYYSFTVDDSLYNARNIILGFSLPIKRGQEEDVRYDPKKPTRAFLPALYY